MYEPGVTDSLKVVRNLYSSQFVGIGVLPGNEYCVVREFLYYVSHVKESGRKMNIYVPIQKSFDREIVLLSWSRGDSLF